VDIDGTDVVTIVDSGKIDQLASDGTFVYWGTHGTDFYSTDGFIYRMKSGTTSPITTVRTNVAVGVLTVNGTSLFWGDYGDLLHQCSKDGSSGDTTLLSGGGLVFDAVCDDAGLWAGDSAGLSLVVFAQSTTVTITSALGFQLAGNQNNLAMDASHVYGWFGPAPEYTTHLIQFSRPGLTNPVDLAQAKKGQSVLSVTGYVYFVDSGALYRVPVDKSADPMRVAGTVGTVSDLASDGGALYWTEYSAKPGNGAIKKIAVY
jgi:hypothetical protein